MSSSRVLHGRTKGKSIRCLTISNDGWWLVAGSADATAIMWDLLEADPDREPRLFNSLGQSVSSVALSGDQRYLLTTDDAGAVMVWNLNPQELVDRGRAFAGRHLTNDERRRYNLPQEPGRQSMDKARGIEELLPAFRQP